MNTARNMIVGLLLRAIRLYQKTLSPDHGVFSSQFPYGYCRFAPSCSMYARDALRAHGVFRGGTLAAWRVLRCNPWSAGGVDEISTKQIP